MDARRKQVYTGIYRFEEHQLMTLKEQWAAPIEELLEELNIERSVFYDRKKEALFLFSLCLFGYAIPELQEELEISRLFPD